MNGPFYCRCSQDRHRLSGPLSGRGCAPPYDRPRQPILPAIIVAAQPAIVVVATHEPASVRLLIMDAIEELRPQATARNMEIRLDGERDPRLIMGDHSLLVRCIANVVGNAIKHAHPGTVVTCSIRNVTLAQNAAIQIEVRDQGPGIAPDFLPRIFETYQQAPGSTVRKGTGREGFGLGLTFVELVVRGHGGTIECGSEPGTGTMFLLTFPCMNEPPAPDVSADS